MVGTGRSGDGVGINPGVRCCSRGRSEIEDPHDLYV